MKDGRDEFDLCYEAKTSDEKSNRVVDHLSFPENRITCAGNARIDLLTYFNGDP